MPSAITSLRSLLLVPLPRFRLSHRFKVAPGVKICECQLRRGFSGQDVPQTSHYPRIIILSCHLSSHGKACFEPFSFKFFTGGRGEKGVASVKVKSNHSSDEERTKQNNASFWKTQQGLCRVHRRTLAGVRSPRMQGGCI